MSDTSRTFVSQRVVRDVDRSLSSEHMLSKQRHEDRHVIYAIICTGGVTAVIALIASIFIFTTILAAIASTVLGVVILIGAVVVFSLMVVCVYDFFEDLRRHSDIERTTMKRHEQVMNIIKTFREKPSELKQDFSERLKQLKNQGCMTDKTCPILTILELGRCIGKAIKETKNNDSFIFLRDLEDHIAAVLRILPGSWVESLDLTGAKIFFHIMQVVSEKYQNSREKIEILKDKEKIGELINKLNLEAEGLWIERIIDKINETNLENRGK